jgi:hypothetical protein
MEEEEYAELKKEINRLTSELVSVASRWEAMCDLLEGEEVSDFMLSFQEVRKLADIISSGVCYV